MAEGRRFEFRIIVMDLDAKRAKPIYRLDRKDVFLPRAGSGHQHVREFLIQQLGLAYADALVEVATREWE